MAFDAFYVRLTVNNIISELEKVTDKTKRVIIRDYDDVLVACDGPRLLTHEDEDPKTVIQLHHILNFLRYDKFDIDLITLDTNQLLQRLYCVDDKELFVIGGAEDGGVFIQSITEDETHVIISEIPEKA